MDAAVKAQWLGALRSGNYQQGKRMLRSRDNKFCCLGVLCDLVAPTDWRTDAEEYFHDGRTGFPNPPVLIAAGLQDANLNQLVDMNDGGKSFNEIADYLEKNF